MAIALKTVGIIVQDMKESLSFYRKLGLDIPAIADGEDNFDYETADGIILGFLTAAMAKRSDPRYTDPTGSSLNLQLSVRRRRRSTKSLVGLSWLDLQATPSRGTPFGASASPGSSIRMDAWSTCTLNFSAAVRHSICSDRMG